MKNSSKVDQRDITLGMAVMDALPVLCFAGTTVLIGTMFRSPLFWAGAALCILAGLGKVLWKLLLAVTQKDRSILNRQFRLLMPAGFALILLSIFLRFRQIDWGNVWKDISSFPGNILFSLCALGFIAMGVLAATLGTAGKKANWLEQSVNLAAQLCLLMGVLLIWYASDSYSAETAALEALEGSPAVQVVRTDAGLLFDGPGSENALIFYPGAKVEYTAYAPLMLRLAEQELDCFLVEMPYNMAIFGLNRAGGVMEQYSYGHWYLGGHSLGGAMAASYAAGHTEELDGLLLLAAYPTGSLKSDHFSVLSVYGSEDRVLNREKLTAGMAYMPESFTEVCVEGGNHAWFGDYGEQAGDGQASIGHEEQWRRTVEAVAAMMSTKQEGSDGK